MPVEAAAATSKAVDDQGKRSFNELTSPLIPLLTLATYLLFLSGVGEGKSSDGSPKGHRSDQFSASSIGSLPMPLTIIDDGFEPAAGHQGSLPPFVQALGPPFSRAFGAGSIKGPLLSSGGHLGSWPSQPLRGPCPLAPWGGETSSRPFGIVCHLDLDERGMPGAMDREMIIVVISKHQDRRRWWIPRLICAPRLGRAGVVSFPAGGLLPTFPASRASHRADDDVCTWGAHKCGRSGGGNVV